MTRSAELRALVRQRAQFACEYCGVTEIDSGGELTIDHHHPPGRGGSQDDPENLVYCCTRCNQYKSDYWPKNDQDSSLWNPRTEPQDTHFVRLADGTLYPITTCGAFTIRRLRLNRPPLVAYRLRQHRNMEEARLLTELQQLIRLQETLQHQHAALLQEQQQLLEQQRNLLQLLITILR